MLLTAWVGVLTLLCLATKNPAIAALGMIPFFAGALVLTRRSHSGWGDIPPTIRAKANRTNALQRLLELSGDMLFEWNPRTLDAGFSRMYQKKRGGKPTRTNFPQVVLDEQRIHPGDAKRFLLAFKHVKRLGTAQVEIRLRDNCEGYTWHALYLAWSGDSKEGLVLGRLTDIDGGRRSLDALREKARRDPFTRLLNKTTVQECIGQLLDQAADGTSGVLFVIDADDFKSVNDTLGHPVGDAVLRDIANQLGEVFRNSDLIGRLGGDEFIVFMNQTTTPDLCRKKAEVLRQAVRRTYHCHGRQHEVTISVGAALYPLHGSTFEELYKNADAALYQAKHEGKNQCVIYADGR